MRTKNVSEKTKWILRIILIAFLGVGLRVWHLEVVQREEKQREAERPKIRAIVQKADRGPIVDRFGIPLAVNKIAYNAAIYYNQIAQIPAISWEEDEKGKKVRRYPRKEYVRSLAKILARTLDLEEERIEDLIYSKAALFPHVPFVLKSGLTEKEHYRLAILEKDWLGIHAEIGSERFYPKGKTGCNIIGTMGSISSKEYFAIADEMSELQKMMDEVEDPCMVSEKAVARLAELKEKAYTLQSLVGKSGIEGSLEQELRGLYGKRIFEVDQKGKILAERSEGKMPVPGQEIALSISIELQEFAEALLAENETIREGRSWGFDPETKERKQIKQPAIKGAAIVAMDPKTGEILALASTPRYDPNDFIPSSHPVLAKKKGERVSHWLETEKYMGAIWDGKQNLVREKYSAKKGFYEEEQPLTWERYLEILFPYNRKLLTFFQKIDDVRSAIAVQEDWETLLYHANVRDSALLIEKMFPKNGSNTSFFEEIRTRGGEVFKRLDTLLHPLASNADRLFAIDLCRLVVHAPAFIDESLKWIGSMKLSRYRTLNQTFCKLEAELKEKAAKQFRKEEFQAWRKENQKTYLAEMRSLEKKGKKAARPYLDYLDRKEQELFAVSWAQKRLDVLLAAAGPEFTALAPKEELKSVLHTFRSYADLERPLLTNYRKLRKSNSKQTEKELAAAFYPIDGFSHSRSYAFQATAPQGSIFKLITAFAALEQTTGENPLSIVDEIKKDPKSPRSFIVASSVFGVPYQRIYKGGRLPKSPIHNIGKIDIVGAIETSSNPYFSILAGDILRKPEDLFSAATRFGFGSLSGINLCGEAKGLVPDDLAINRTGLYSTAIGQHKLLVTPLQTAIMLSVFANGGDVLKPVILKESEAQKRGEIDLPQEIRGPIFEGMDRVLWSSKGTARPGLLRGLLGSPALFGEYLSLRHQVIGKTGTAEIMFNPDISPSSLPQMYKHIWFGAISFEGEGRDLPEIVVAVLLRYGGGGKEAAPLAARVIQKWREIKKVRQSR